MLEKSFEALKAYDWGPNRNALKPIDDAVAASEGDSAAREKLEEQLAAVLKSKAPRGAKGYVCRKLMRIGTAASVPALAALLPDADESHMARYALERIPASEAAAALRDALPKLGGALKIGVIASLGVRQDAASVSALGALVGDSDGSVATAAASALGAIRSADAAAALSKAKPNEQAKAATADASFACAEALLSDGKNADALAIYKGFIASSQPKHIGLAARRGMLACAAKK